MKSHDKYTKSLLLSLPFTEGTGALTQDVAKPHHPMTMVHSPVWTQLASGMWVLEFDGANDYLECPAASCPDLDFTSGDFSLGCWCYFDNLATTRVIMGRYELGVSGWDFSGCNGDTLRLRSSFGGGGVTTSSVTTHAMGVLVTSRWHFVGCSRSGLWPSLFIDGTDMPVTYDGAWTDPVACAQDLVIGVEGTTKNTFFFNGKLWNPRIWNRCLAPHDHKAMFHRERHLFGV